MCPYFQMGRTVKDSDCSTAGLHLQQLPWAMRTAPADHDHTVLVLMISELMSAVRTWGT